MKNIFVIIDGASGKPGVRYKTPYQRASKPNLDLFALKGKTGVHYPVDKKIAPESDVAITALLGYDPYKYFVGRGPFEAIGSGFRLKGKSFVAFRCNFATVKGNYILEDRRAGRTLLTKEAKELAEYLNRKMVLPVKFKFMSTTEHRGVLVFYGKFSDNVSNVDPAYVRKGKFGVAKKFKPKIKFCKPLDKKPLSKKTADLVNMFVKEAHALLDIHPMNIKRKKKGLKPANIVLVRDAGNRLPKLPKKKHWVAVVGMPLEKGITSGAGMKVLSFGYPILKNYNVYNHLIKSLKTEIDNSKRYLDKYWNKYDDFYVHFKPTDVAGHDGNPKEKERMIELIDKEFFSWLKTKKNFKLIVTSDHSTPCRLKIHSADPVPVLYYNSEKKYKGTKFNEADCKRGSLGIMKGVEVLKLFSRNF